MVAKSMQKTILLSDTVLDDFDIDVEITIARDEEKIAAILYCFSCVEDGEGYTIRTARNCATRYTSIGEKMTYRIIRLLSYYFGYITYDTKIRKWVPTEKMPRFKSFKQALEFVMSAKIRFY